MNYISSFSDEFEKIAVEAETAKKILLSIPALAGAGLSLYDLYKSRGYSDDSAYVNSVVGGNDKEYKMADTASYVKKVMPEVKVVDTEEKFYHFFKKEAPIAKHLPDSTLKEMASDAFAQFTSGNAAAASGKGGHYLIASKKAPVDVLEHELGHLRDFKEKGIVTTDQSYNEYTTGFLNSLAQSWFKSKYMKGNYMSEVNAWDKAKPSATMDKIRKAALGTYEKGWHRSRALNSALATAIYTALVVNRQRTSGQGAVA